MAGPGCRLDLTGACSASASLAPKVTEDQVPVSLFLRMLTWSQAQSKGIAPGAVGMWEGRLRQLKTCWTLPLGRGGSLVLTWAGATWPRYTEPPWQ